MCSTSTTRVMSISLSNVSSKSKKVRSKKCKIIGNNYAHSS